MGTTITIYKYRIPWNTSQSIYVTVKNINKRRGLNKFRGFLKHENNKRRGAYSGIYGTLIIN